MDAVAVLANIPSITLSREVLRECTDIDILGDQEKRHDQELKYALKKRGMPKITEKS